jgi:uncharacterized protein YozE (UPF0346 family)
MSLDISAIAYAVRTRLTEAPWAQPHYAAIKLTHIQECIAAALHHNTLASLQSSGELRAPTNGHYLAIDLERVARRAQELGISSDTDSGLSKYAEFRKLLTECLAEDFDGIEVCSSEGTLYERFLDWIEDTTLKDVDVAGQMAMANHNGLPEVSGVDVDLISLEPTTRVLTRELKLAVQLEPDEERLYSGHVVKVDANLLISKPTRALFGFDLHIGNARLTDGSGDEEQALRQPVEVNLGDEPQQLGFALAKVLDMNFAAADDLVDATLNAKFDANGGLTGYVFDFRRVQLEEDDEGQMRNLLPDLTLNVTPAWLDNIRLDRHSKVGDARTRYYFHGDESESHSGMYMCKICDCYAGPSHFEDHPAANLHRYDDDQHRWQHGPARWKIGKHRPQEPVNLFTEALVSREASRSDFHRWLVMQTDRNDAVGDFAQDAMENRKFPAAETQKAELERYLRLSGASKESIRAFGEAWAEFLTFQNVTQAK